MVEASHFAVHKYILNLFGYCVELCGTEAASIAALALGSTQRVAELGCFALSSFSRTPILGRTGNSPPSLPTSVIYKKSQSN